MVLPFITAISRDVFETVPPVLKEAAYGIGCTTTEVVRKVVIPYTRVGVIGGVMLGLGRALGETMAVTFVIGNAHRLSGSILAPGTTISATIANEFTEAVGDLYTSSLIALGPDPVHHHFHRARLCAAHANAPRKTGGRLKWLSIVQNIPAVASPTLSPWVCAGAPPRSASAFWSSYLVDVGHQGHARALAHRCSPR